MAPPQPLSAANILFVVAVHLRPPLWRHCRPPDRPSPKTYSTISDRGRDRVEQPEPDRVFSSRPASGSHDEERTWLPTSGFEFALAPKKPSEPNPPPTRKQDPIKSAQKESFHSTQHSGRRRARKARKCLRYLQRASHQDAPFSRSGFAVGVLRHNLGIKLDQASTFSPSGFCIRPVARTAREPDLDGRERGAVLANRRPRVAPCAPCRC